MFLTNVELYTKLNELNDEGKRLCVITTNAIQDYTLMRLLDAYGITWMSGTRLLDELKSVGTSEILAYYFNMTEQGDFRLTYLEFYSKDSLERYKRDEGDNIVFMEF